MVRKLTCGVQGNSRSTDAFFVCLLSDGTDVVMYWCRYRAIFLELFTRRPIFQAGDEIDQLYATFKLMGTPSLTNWPEARDLPWFELFKPKLEQPSRLRETFFGPEKNVKTEAGMALAERLLSLRPHDRPSAREALTCPYFTSEDPPMELPTDVSVSHPFFVLFFLNSRSVLTHCSLCVN